MSYDSIKSNIIFFLSKSNINWNYSFYSIVLLSNWILKWYKMEKLKIQNDPIFNIVTKQLKRKMKKW